MVVVVVVVVVVMVAVVVVAVVVVRDRGGEMRVKRDRGGYRVVVRGTEDMWGGGTGVGVERDRVGLCVCGGEGGG